MPRYLLTMLKVPLLGALLGLGAAGAAVGIQLWGAAGMVVILVGGQVGAFAAVFMHSRRERITPVGRAEAEDWHQHPGEIDECRGWKTASMRIADGNVLFTGVFRGTYTTEAQAVCELGGQHPAPRADCTCGFHIYYDKESALRKQQQCETDILLEVELYGTVVEHDRGARGEEQTILAVHVRPRCHRCTRRATGLAEVIRGEERRLIPSCSRCTSSQELWDLQDIAQLCGTEVRWDVQPGRRGLLGGLLLP